MNEKKPQPLDNARHFSVRLSATRRGARLARHFSVAWMRVRGLPVPVVESAEHVVAELATNAATHGRVTGRDFLLVLKEETDVLRIALTDTRGEELPRLPGPQLPDGEAESGRGLVLVEALADRWGVIAGPVPRKTVWAELDLPVRELAGPRRETRSATGPCQPWVSPVISSSAAR
ncbi:ATP-binding protein [Streptomyces sp. NA04227]|uniref:ATP-binding protein n=1 Tax=Streptomyces sp. NA04227 TaxID=2742136 RepID=UPI0015928FF5|nr:ATP-binding protein [Streptomyces sp. NA04227]QKW09217.1 ATP-binding protein [Streptomyces sp. NA04227]